MHFSIPDTQEMVERNGSTYTAYNVHINGVFHCAVRYRQLFNLHAQLKKEFGPDDLPNYPSKKILPLTSNQLEERRIQLEKYIQIVGQDSKLVTSSLLVGFLLSAQQETTCEKKQELKLDIYTMNQHVISIRVLSTDRTEQVLSKTCRQINLPSQYMSYFSLYLIRRSGRGEVTILRKLQDFESPYISLKASDETHRIVIRKSYWDINYDQELIGDQVALNLLYAQTISDLENGWVYCSREVRAQLAQLQARLAKRAYIELARTLKYYGFMQFRTCVCDYPRPDTRVQVAIGSDVLSIRLLSSSVGAMMSAGLTAAGSATVGSSMSSSAATAGGGGGGGSAAGAVNGSGFLSGNSNLVKEGCFKVTRMKCWRITATHNKENPSNASTTTNSRQTRAGGAALRNDYDRHQHTASASDLEISFEYLMSKDKLQWITIASEQAILMSACLQSIVDELLVKKTEGRLSHGPAGASSGSVRNGGGGARDDVSRGAAPPQCWSYLKRDGSTHLITLDSPDVLDGGGGPGSGDAHHSDSGANNHANNHHHHRAVQQNNSVSSMGSEQVKIEEINSRRSDDAFSIKRLQEKFSSVSFKSGKEFVENNAFEGIGDDDL